MIEIKSDAYLEGGGCNKTAWAKIFKDSFMVILKSSIQSYIKSMSLNKIKYVACTVVSFTPVEPVEDLHVGKTVGASIYLQSGGNTSNVISLFAFIPSRVPTVFMSASITLVPLILTILEPEQILPCAKDTIATLFTMGP